MNSEDKLVCDSVRATEALRNELSFDIEAIKSVLWDVGNIHRGFVPSKPAPSRFQPDLTETLSCYSVGMDLLRILKQANDQMDAGHDLGEDQITSTLRSMLVRNLPQYFEPGTNQSGLLGRIPVAASKGFCLTNQFSPERQAEMCVVGALRGARASNAGVAYFTSEVYPAFLPFFEIVQQLGQAEGLDTHLHTFFGLLRQHPLETENTYFLDKPGDGPFPAVERGPELGSRRFQRRVLLDDVSDLVANIEWRNLVGSMQEDMAWEPVLPVDKVVRNGDRWDAVKPYHGGLTLKEFVDRGLVPDKKTWLAKVLLDVQKVTEALREAFSAEYFCCVTPECCYTGSDGYTRVDLASLWGSQRDDPKLAMKSLGDLFGFMVTRGSKTGGITSRQLGRFVDESSKVKSTLANLLDGLQNGTYANPQDFLSELVGFTYNTGRDDCWLGGNRRWSLKHNYGLGPNVPLNARLVASPEEGDLHYITPALTRLEQGKSSSVSDFKATMTYCLEHLLGKGQEGEVWQASQRSGNMSRRVACKVAKLSMPAKRKEAFFSEAAAIDITSPFCVATEQPFLWGSSEGVELRVVPMEYLDGQNLRELMVRAQTLRRAKSVGFDFFDPWVIAFLAERICRVDYAGVHRDIKPENLFVTSNGRAVLTDFGGRLVGDVDYRAFFGSPAYMPPEQFDDPNGVKQSADVYALARTVEEILRYKNPQQDLITRFVESQAGALSSVITQRDVVCKQVAGCVFQPITPLENSFFSQPETNYLNDALRQALHPDPAKRYQTLGEFGAELNQFMFNNPLATGMSHAVITNDSIRALVDDLSFTARKPLADTSTPTIRSTGTLRMSYTQNSE